MTEEKEKVELVRFIKPEITFKDLVLSDSLRLTLDQFQKEFRYRKQFQKYGLRARRRLILSGPPGCGKTSIAHALAAKARRQVGYVNMEELIDSWLGQSAKNVSRLFTQLGKRNCILLLDEMDMVAKKRVYGEMGAQNEMARVTSALLRALDSYKGNSMIVGATNVGGTLDPAVVRRFDDVIQMGMPDRESYEKLFDLRMAAFEISKKVRAELIETMVKNDFSLADADLLCSDVKKQVLLSFPPTAAREDISTIVHKEHITLALSGARARKAVLESSASM